MRLPKIAGSTPALFIVAANLTALPTQAQSYTYQFTPITSANLSTPGSSVAGSRAVGITNTGVVAGVYDVNGLDADGSPIPPFTGYEYAPHTGAVSTLTYGKPDGSEFDAVSGGGRYILGDYANFQDPTGVLHYFTDCGGMVQSLPDPFGIPSPLSANPSPNYAFYQSINDAGAAVGFFSDDGGSTEQGFVFQNGTFTRLEAPGADTGYTESYGINASGTVVGTYTNTVTHADGYLRTANGTWMTLDVPGARNTDIFGISDNGYVFGDYNLTKGAPYDNFVYYDGTFILGVDAPGYQGATNLYGINTSGQIAGYYVGANGLPQSFYATPVATPEPSSLVPLGVGALILCAWRRKAE